METFIAQIIALVTFFAFPAIQYYLLKRFSKKEGRPELWYLPSYGFRLVIRNIPNKRTLSDIKCRTFIRKVISANSGSSVSTLVDETLVEREDFFLFPGYDQILLCFEIKGENKDDLSFVHTDKLGKPVKEIPLQEVDVLISDYTANVENYFNFDIKLGKRVIIDKAALISYWTKIKLSNVEGRIDGYKILDVG